MSEEARKQLLAFQKNEITEYRIYKKLAGRIRHPENRQVLLNIADDELRHARIWENYSKKEIKPECGCI